jgi:hypothetical protein
MSLLASCDQRSGTGGALVEVDVSAELVGVEPGWRNAHGWQIELEEASLELGALYLYENPPPLAAVAPRGVWERAVGLFVSEAYAHPGDEHFFGGRVMMEVIEAQSLRLGAPVTVRGVEAIEGSARSMSLLLGGRAGVFSRVKGVARRGEQEVAFEGSLVSSSWLGQRVDGVGARVELEEGGRVVVRVMASRWLEQINFEEMVVLSGGARGVDEGRVFRLEEGEQPHTAWLLSARSSAAFQVVSE